MEIKATLLKPFTHQEKLDFIKVNKGYEIRENDEELQAWGLSAEEQQEEAERRERERKANLNLTKADFWIALLDRNITKADVKEKIALIPDETLKAKTLIRIDEADHFWRGDASMDIIGAMFGISSGELDYLFEHKELPVIENSESEE